MFIKNTGFGDTVLSSAVQSDGKLLFGGQFLTYNGITSNRIARVNTDGSLDKTFNIGTGFSAYVTSLAVQSDGKVLAGGLFNAYNGVAAYYFIRLNTNGTIDETFPLDIGFNGVVYSTAIQSDGKVLAGGLFTTYSGANAYYFIRLNTNGTIDETFPHDIGFNGIVYSIVIQSDNKILIGGEFDNYNGVISNKLIRLNIDGTIDETFVIGDGFNNTVYSIAPQSDGKILVGGVFSTYSGVTRNRIIRLNSNGSVDDTFVIGNGFTTSNISSLAIQSDGKIVVVGAFNTYSGATANGIIRLNTNGSIDTTFTIGTGFNGTASTLIIKSNNKIFIGGGFTLYNGVTANRIIGLNTNGSIDNTFIAGTGFNNYVNSLVLQSDGKILIGGQFTTYSGITRNRIIRLNTDSNIDTGFAIGTGFSSTINVLTLQSDGKIIAGGQFTAYSGVTRNRIIRLNSNGSVDTGFAIGTGFSNTINSVAVQSDGKIIAGGQFTTYSGVTRNRIIRLNTDGSLDTGFAIGTGFNNTINSIAIQSDNKILVGGVFTTYSGVTRNRIIRLNTDGSIDNTFVIGTGFGGDVYSLIIQPDNKIVINGNFTAYSGVSKTRLIRLNSNGSIDNTFVIGSGLNKLVNSSTIQSDGKLLFGGQFTSYNGVTRNRIVRVNSNGSLDTGFTCGVGFNGTVNAIILQPDNKILIGGQFVTYSGFSVNYIVRLNSNGSVDTEIPTIIILSSANFRLWEKIGYVKGITPTDEEVLTQLLDIENNILVENPIDTQD